MKRTVLINLICSFITVLVLAFGIIFAITVNDPTVFAKPKLVISSESSTAVYDGKPLTNGKWHLASGELKSGHELSVEVSGVQTDVGISENYVFAKVTDADGEDVSDKYNIEYLPGALNVKPRSITVKANSDKKDYDGLPLTNDGFEISSTMELLPDHNISVVVSGSVVDGETKNSVVAVTITNAAGVDVTKNYTVKTVDGKLVVENGPSGYKPDPDPDPGPEIPPIEGFLPPDENGFKIGLPDSIGNFTDMDGEPPILFVVNSNTSGKIYLKQLSYGDYTGQSFGKANPYTTLWNGYLSAYYLASRSASNAGSATSTVTIDPKVNMYAIPYYALATTSDVQKSDTVVKGNATAPYEIQYILSPKSFILPADMQAYEAAYRTFVNANYLNIDSYTKSYFDQIISDNGFSRYDSDIISTVASYVQNAASYNLKYDRALDESDNIAVEFLNTYKEGICQHYALAATMLYRALGIPARFTVGYVADAVAGEDVEVTIMNGHAWVEVYVDGQGWIQVEVTGSSSGDISPEPPVDPPKDDEYTIGLPTIPGNDPVFVIQTDKSGTVYLKEQSYGDYTGQSFTAAPKYDYFVESNRSAYYLPTYALDNGGLSTSTMIINPLTGKYVLPYYTTRTGEVQSTDTAIIGDGSGAYTVEYYYWTGIAGVVIPSRYQEFEDAYSAFVYENYLAVDDGTRAFMDSIIAENGFSLDDKSVITKVASYIKTAAKYNLHYDRKLDEQPNIAVSFLSDYKEGICQHYAVAATMLYRALGIPARFTVGYSSYVIAGTDNTVTANMGHAWVEVYVQNIGWINVEVTGSPESDIIAMELKPVDTSALYNGVDETLYAQNKIGGFTIESKGYTYDVTVSGSITGLGKAKSTITELVIYDPDGEKVYEKSTGLGSDKFKIEYKDGVVHHYISSVEFGSNGRTQTYDGTVLETIGSDCYLQNGEVYAHLGYTYVITPTGNIRNAGAVAATFKVNFFKDGEDCTDHFKIAYTYGKLTVNAREIVISAESAYKVFDGTALTADGIIYDPELLAEGDYVYSYVINGSQKNIGKSSNVLKSVTILNEDGEDVTKNYKITIRDGVLTVTEPTT